MDIVRIHSILKQGGRGSFPAPITPGRVRSPGHSQFLTTWNIKTFWLRQFPV